jgi:hypothetical protein
VAAALVRLQARMPRRPRPADEWATVRAARARVHHAVGRRTPAPVKRGLRRAGLRG